MYIFCTLFLKARMYSVHIGQILNSKTQDIGKMVLIIVISFETLGFLLVSCLKLHCFIYNKKSDRFGTAATIFSMSRKM
jgi:hypothetical protein